jgi:DNA-binding transcriptional LysR family regulator
VAGAGIALIPRFLIEPELAAGTLISPFAHVLETQEAYYLVHRRDDARPALAQFATWLAAQAAG